MKSLKDEIEILKKEKEAVILAHYYVPDDVQAIADYTGDSFYLSKVAKETDAKILVFAGVSFMGESAKILNPEKKVLLPDMTADCAMAHMADIEKIKTMKETDPDLAVVCYINSTAKLKQYSDVCVTSANAVKVVKALPNKRIYFIPDQHLGSFVAKQVPEKEVILGEGYCPVHHQITAEEVRIAKMAHPDAAVFVHPECPKEVVELADYAGSTSGIITHVAESDGKEFLIGTETGVMYELKKQNPEKSFYPIREEQCCYDMKKVTLEKIRDCLKYENNEVHVDEEVSQEAKQAMERMLLLAR